jgi:hypothetical protein
MVPDPLRGLRLEAGDAREGQVEEAAEAAFELSGSRRAVCAVHRRERRAAKVERRRRPAVVEQARAARAKISTLLLRTRHPMKSLALTLFNTDTTAARRALSLPARLDHIQNLAS